MCSVPFNYTIVSSIIIRSQMAAMFYALRLKNLWAHYNLLFFPVIDPTFGVQSKNYLPVPSLKCFFLHGF